MKFSRLYSTIIQWFRSFYPTKNTISSTEPMWFLSLSSHDVPQIMACGECTRTSPPPGCHLVDSLVNSQTYWLCPHVLAEVRTSVKDSPLVTVGYWYPSMKAKSK